MVGFSEVLQTTPCSVGLDEPRTVTLPLPVAVVCGNVRDGLGGDGGSQQRGEGDILTISCARCIGGIRPHVIERVGCQAGDVAGEGTGGADRTIRGFGCSPWSDWR